LDSRVLCDQQLNERMQQRFAPFSDIVHEREETQGDREFLLGNAPMGAQLTPQQRPEALHRMHMDCTTAVSIFISGVLALSMVHTLMLVSPCTQASIHAVLIRIHKRTWGHGLFDERLNGLLLHIRTHADDHLTAPLHHAKDRRRLLLSCAASPLSFEAVSTSFASRVLHHLRLPLMAGNPRGFVALHLI